MESVCVLRHGLSSLIKSILYTGIQTLYRICVRSKTVFHLDGMSSHGPPKGVYQSLSSSVQQCAGEDVRQYSQHNLYHADHMKINKPRIAH